MSKIDFDAVFLSFLKSGEKLKWELDNNVNLMEYADRKVLLIADLLLALIPKSKKQEIIGEKNVNSVLDLLKRERPDLYSIIISYPNGRAWVERNIENFKRRFL